MILTGGALTLLATAGVIASSEPVPLLLFAALFGAGEIVANVAGLALLAETAEGEGRTRRFGVSFAAAGFAGFVASAIGGTLAGPAAAWLGAPTVDVRVFRLLLAFAGAIGATSGVPILLLSSRERPPHVAAPRQWGVLARFGAIQALFGFGAGSFLPFVNLFFAERFGLPFAAIGVILGAISVGGGTGALVHTRFADRLGSVRSLVALWVASLPLALVGAFAPGAYVAAAALLGRGIAMTTAVPAYDAFIVASFRPRERSGAQAILTTLWALAHGGGALVSGAVRAALGTAGFTVNLLTLMLCYALAIVAFVAFFRGHVPRGDAVQSPR